jgi:glycosyltransferase involved in cell wall biosynthesis
VDDGSRDGTFAELQRLNRRDPRVRVVRLVRNFGHQAALTAGLHAARGEAVVSMDADLQHPPEVLPDLLRAWRSGYDIVYAVRQSAAGAPPLKRWTSRLFYSFIRRISEIELPPNAADFRLISRSVLEVINALPERSRLLRGLVHWTGYPFTLLPYEEAERHAGSTKYTWRRMFNLCVDSVTAFSTLPLRVSTFVGAASAAAAALYALGAITIRLFLPAVAVDGWASVLVSVLFLGGIQLLALGLIGEYIGRIFQEAKQRPLYLVRERVGFAAGDRAGAVSLARAG